MPEINISIKNKKAKAATSGFIVNGNSDYTIIFDFDDEWSNVASKTARFVFGGQ